MNREPLLEVQDLSVSFQTHLGKVRAVNHVSFSVYPKETVAIVGESGCGKSVTAQSIVKLIPMPPGKIEGGKVFLRGSELLSKSTYELENIRGREIGMIFQDPMTALNPTMRIGKQIMEGLIKHRKMSFLAARTESIELLHLVGISDPETRIEQYPHELSGGMRQRVMIAIALACNPHLLIADEPTTALDVTIQAQILELLKKIQKKTDAGIILITHDLGIVAGMCDRVLVMYAGQIIEEGSVEEIYYSPRHPYTQGLVRSIPRLDCLKGEKLLPICGAPPNLLSPPSGCRFSPRCPQAMRICQSTFPPLSSLSEEHKVRCWLEVKNE